MMSRFERILELNVPIESCYKALLHFERYPDFIPYVQSIQPKGRENVWHWRVSLPGGAKEAEWDVEVQGVRHQHHAISWHTIRDADVAHAGAITLHADSANRKTLLQFVLEGKACGITGSAESQIEQAIELCLVALKNQIEQSAAGSVSTGYE